METVLLCILGLGLFLVGIKFMSDGLKKIVGDKVKVLINKVVNNPFLAIIIGFVITTIIQSSSGTIALVISLLTAGLLSLESAAFIMLGANIGSATTSIIIGLNITKYSPIIVFIGAFLVFFFSNHKQVRRIGRTILGFGLMFYGLECLSNSLGSLTSSPAFTNALNTMDKNPFLALLVGLVSTSVVQSSGATIGVIQKLYNLNSDVMSLKVVIAFILGANIGTIITGLIASLKGNSDSKRLVVFDYIFNILNCILFMAMIIPVELLFSRIESALFVNYGAGLVSCLTIFIKVVGVLIFGWLTKPLIKLLNKMFKSKANNIDALDIKLNKELIKTSPTLALEYVYEKIIEMKNLVNLMYNSAIEYLFTRNSKSAETLNLNEEIVDKYYEVLHEYLTMIPSNTINNNKYSSLKIYYLDSIKDLERIADHCVNLIERLDERYEHKLSFNEEAKNNLNSMVENLNKMIVLTFKAIEDENEKMADCALKYEDLIDQNEKYYRQLFIEHQCSSIDDKEDLNIVEILSNFERIGDHLTNISEHIIDYKKKA